jgi:hypothetical protein
MIGRSTILAIVWLVLPFGLAVGQQAGFAGQPALPIEPLRRSIDAWQQTLNGIEIDRLAVDKDQYLSLKGSRDSSLVWLQTLKNDLAELEKGATLSGQARLLLEMVQLQNSVSEYSQDFRRVYQASGDASKAIPGNLALKWMNQTGAIVAEVQASYETLSDTVLRRMDSADEQLKKPGCHATGAAS